MKTVIFREEAAEDLRGIIAWYEDVAPHSVDAILADIHRSIDLLCHYPQAGVQVHDHAFRRIVTLKYHFKVAYRIEETSVVILGIFRFQNRES